MKVRTDYVSNSSSTSFMLIGDVFDKEDFKNSSYFKTENSLIEPDFDEAPFSDYSESEFWNDKCRALGLRFRHGIENYYNGYVVGLDYYDMEDNETKAAFHKRVEGLLRTAFPEKNTIEVSLRKDAGYDG